jgi:hypothetical protein
MTLFLSMLGTLGFVFIMVLLRTLLRSDRLAFGATVLVVAVSTSFDLFVSPHAWIGALIVMFAVVLRIILLMRVGLVANMATQIVFGIFSQYPIIFDTSVWYSGICFAALTVVAILTLYGFRTSLGSGRLFEPSRIHLESQEP